MNDQHNAAYAALLLRLSLGIMILAHGLLKVFVFTPAGTAGFFASLGLPGWLAYPTIGIEIFGGILLIVGLQSRLVALALVPILIGSLWAHSGNGWLFSNPNGGWEYSLFLTVAALTQILLGDGAYSLGSLMPARKQAYQGRSASA
ncbi:MAG: DoxX family protein [Gammaproteobacteria bacterium]|nr:DoxX family protein [Gammaproteobacteria bacterium]